MHMIYKSIKTKSFNCTLGKETKTKVFLKRSVFDFVGDLLVNMKPLYWLQLNNLLSLLSLLPRAALTTLSHMSSQYEIMVGIPAS